MQDHVLCFPYIAGVSQRLQLGQMGQRPLKAAVELEDPVIS